MHRTGQLGGGAADNWLTLASREQDQALYRAKDMMMMMMMMMGAKLSGTVKS